MASAIVLANRVALFCSREQQPVDSACGFPSRLPPPLRMREMGLTDETAGSAFSIHWHPLHGAYRMMIPGHKTFLQ